MNAAKPDEPRHPLRVQDALARIGAQHNPRFIEVLRHGSLQLELYAPHGADLQQPHSRDELYVVVSGSGQFDNAGVVSAFGPGDALFVPAFQPHRFVDFTEDFAVWVMFYGPEGGEAADLMVGGGAALPNTQESTA